MVYRNTETANILNDKVTRSGQDDVDGIPPPTLYECQSYFKRISDFTLAQNNQELLVDADKWQEKIFNVLHTIAMFLCLAQFCISHFYTVIKRFCFQVIIIILFSFIMHQYRKQMIVVRYGQFCLTTCDIRPPVV